MSYRYLRVASDLHLEQWLGQNPRFLCDTFLPTDLCDPQSILILAGDISSKPAQLYSFLEECLLRFQKVIYVSGNHEYYGHVMEKWENDFHEWKKDKPNLFAGTSTVSYEELDDVRFIFTTLWADGGKDLYERTMVGRGLRDFHVVKVKQDNQKVPRRFTVSDMMALHQAQKKKLIELVEQPFDGKTVVITHHMPSYRLCHPRFGTDINGGFASNCDNLLATEKVNLWIHGHTHDRISTKMWNTRIECNPSGYEMEAGSKFNEYRRGPVFVRLSDLAVVPPREDHLDAV